MKIIYLSSILRDKLNDEYPKTFFLRSLGEENFAVSKRLSEYHEAYRKVEKDSLFITESLK